jgi:hypothetical protein
MLRTQQAHTIFPGFPDFEELRGELPPAPIYFFMTSDQRLLDTLEVKIGPVTAEPIKLFPGWRMHDRPTTGISNARKARFWQKLKQNGMLNRYTTQGQQFWWPKVCSSLMEDSIEMLKEIQLVHMPSHYEAATDFKWAIGKPCNLSGPMKLLATMSDKALDPEDFSDFKTEGTGPESDYLLTYQYHDKTYKTTINGNIKYDNPIVTSLGHAWNEWHPGHRSFYKISSEPGSVMYLTAQEAGGFTKATGIRVQKM